ncbi:hypothetical protein YTPLAS18_10070 [Nitrospira sp.]|nr:hypothetical protein YTPLAS18_10070 [Nitrospira sp.]
MKWKRLLLIAGSLVQSLLSPTVVPAQDIQRLQAGVVKIVARPPGEQPRTGTGFIVRLQEGSVYIITSAHVVGNDPQPRLEFFTRRNVAVPADRVRDVEESDPLRGLALVMVGGDKVPEGVTALPLAPATEITVGEDTLVIGFPAGAGPWNVTKGTISSRQGRNLYFSPPVNEGNSGGPIIQKGKVVGLVAGGGGAIAQGVLAASIQSYLEGFDLAEIIGKDGAPMVLVPAGEFWMGSLEVQGDKNEHPRHRVHLDAFYIDKYEISVFRYHKFVQATSALPGYWGHVNLANHGNLPVVGVDWFNAEAYCRWAGKRLSTEAEWEKAARGTDGRTYPWGNEEPTPTRAIFGRKSIRNVYDEALRSVDSLEAGRSPYGAYHLAGNVWEWVADWYAKDYYRQSPGRNPTGPSNGLYRVLRGGSWRNDPRHLRSALRTMNEPSDWADSIGFRCAQDDPE